MAVKPAVAGSLDELIDRSQWIVIGNVERVLASRVPSDVSQPITEFDLHFREVLKGQLGAEDVRVRQYGGTVRGCGVPIVGYTPRPGDYGAFFLSDAGLPDGVLALSAAEGAFVLDANGRDDFTIQSSGEPFTLNELRARFGVSGQVKIADLTPRTEIRSRFFSPGARARLTRLGTKRNGPAELSPGTVRVLLMGEGLEAPRGPDGAEAVAGVHAPAEGGVVERDQGDEYQAEDE